MAILDDIKSAGLKEYGLYPENLAQKLIKNQGAEALVAALNNADVDGVALQLLEKEPRKIFYGMELAAEVLKTHKKILHIPEYAAKLAAELSPMAEAENVELVAGIVNVRKCENSCLCHIVTMADLADLAKGEYADGVYVSVNSGQFRKVSASAALKELVGEDVKGIKTGYVVRDSDALGLTVQEANLENGVLNAITEDDCIAAMVDSQLNDCRRQSCGKCVFCREGLLQLEAIQKDVTIGKGRLDQLDMTREIGEAMCFSTPCSLGQNAARIALSAVEAFQGEYEEHIKKHKCAANSCTAFQKIYVDPKACTGCAQCVSACPADAIDGAAGYIHLVFDNNCTRCGRCISACPEKAIHLTAGSVPKLPDRMLRVGRFR